ncbi:MAG: methyltransferase, partial [Lachnospiraceae bacterium]|nr:methyltransferase [Lachnospiraceae bacterium]
MLKRIMEELDQGQEIRKNLIQIKEYIKEEEKRRELSELLTDDFIFINFLQHEDPKVRKNTALILGQLDADKSVTEALYEAYKKEETLFVKSSYLTSLKNLDCDEYMPYFEERYEELLSADVPENEKKHVREERKALEQLLNREQKHSFCGFEIESEVILTTDRGFAEVTAGQIYRAKTAISSSGVRVRTKNLRPILNIRTYREILFPIRDAKNMKADAKTVGKILRDSNLIELLEQHLEGSAPYYFRIQVNSSMEGREKAEFIKETVCVLEEESGYQLVNSKDRYEIEIRLIQNKERSFNAYLKFYTLPLHRFSYRENALAVSIHPSLAALLLQLAKPYLTEQAAVLDPFCGVGTMLIEREQILHTRTLYGTDIFGEAIQGARENSELANVEAVYIQRDFFDFSHRHKFDEIITNMPVKG